MIRSLNSPDDNNRPFWIDVQEPSEEELNGLAAKHNIPETLIKDCLDPTHLPKFEVYDQIRFFIFRFADESVLDKQEADSIRELTRKMAVFLFPNGMITVHRCAHDFLDKNWETWQKRSLEKQSQLPHLFNSLMKELIRTFDRSLNKFEKTFEQYELWLLRPMKSEARIERFYYLKRKATVFKKMLWAMLEVLRKADDLPFKGSTHFKNLLEEGEKHLFHAEELEEDAKHLMATQLALASHRTNEVVRVLTIFSVFFLPLTFIVGIYGMNFEVMPELKWQFGYPVVMLSMVAVTLFIAAWFKKNRWM